MSEASLRGKAAIIGIGQSPVGKVPGRSPLWLAADAARKAIADAGLKKSSIDGVLSGHALASPFHRFSVAFSEYFGLQPTFSNTLQVSGATAATMFGIGAAAIQAGLAENMLIVAADSLMTGLSPASRIAFADRKSRPAIRDAIWYSGCEYIRDDGAPSYEGIRHYGRAACRSCGHPSSSCVAHAGCSADKADYRRGGARFRHGDDTLSQARLFADLRRRCGFRVDLGSAGKSAWDRKTDLHPGGG